MTQQLLAFIPMVDASIIRVENIHKRLEEWDKSGASEADATGVRTRVILHAMQEVGRSVRLLRAARHHRLFWMPIQTRTEMLATGIRSQLGIKVFGDDLAAIEEAARRWSRFLPSCPALGAPSQNG